MLQKDLVPFHFVLHSSLRITLKCLAMNNGFQMKKLIVLIFHYVNPLLEMYQTMLEDCGNQREKVGADSEMVVEIPYYCKRQILLLRATSNIWSMAIIVRRVLQGFINLVNRYGFDGAITALKMIEKNRKKIRAYIRKKNNHMVTKNLGEVYFSIDFCVSHTTKGIHFRE